MGRVISVVNRKGGVGKTTLSIGLADAFVSEFRLSTVVVDLDPQANATRCLLTDEHYEQSVQSKRNLTGYLSQESQDLERAPTDFVHGMVGTIRERADVAYALMANSDAYWGYESEQLRSGQEAEFRKRLEAGLERLAEVYDIVMVDCPPGQTIGAEIALGRSDIILCPITPERMAVWGKELLATYANENAPDALVRFIVTMKQNNKTADALFEEIEEHKDVLRNAGQGTKFSSAFFSRSVRVQKHIESRRQNRHMHQLWGNKAHLELINIARAIKEELDACESN